MRSNRHFLRFLLCVVAIKEARSEKRCILRAFGRRFLRSNQHFIIVCGGAKRGKKQKTLCSQTIRSAVFALRPSPFVLFAAPLSKVRCKKHFILRPVGRRFLRSSRHFFVVCGGAKRGKKRHTLYSQNIWSAVLVLKPSLYRCLRRR